MPLLLYYRSRFLTGLGSLAAEGSLGPPGRTPSTTCFRFHCLIAGSLERGFLRRFLASPLHFTSPFTPARASSAHPQPTRRTRHPYRGSLVTSTPGSELRPELPPQSTPPRRKAYKASGSGEQGKIWLISKRTLPDPNEVNHLGIGPGAAPGPHRGLEGARACSRDWRSEYGTGLARPRG